MLGHEQQRAAAAPAPAASPPKTDKIQTVTVRSTDQGSVTVCAFSGLGGLSVLLLVSKDCIQWCCLFCKIRLFPG
jgi:hypothetical protein